MVTKFLPSKSTFLTSFQSLSSHMSPPLALNPSGFSRFPDSFWNKPDSEIPSCTLLIELGSSPATSINVGKISTVPDGKFVTLGAMFAGHSTIVGTRSPPS